MERKIKIDTKGEGKDNIALSDSKEEEKRFEGKLQRVEIRNGFALSTQPDKYKDHVRSLCF